MKMRREITDVLRMAVVTAVAAMIVAAALFLITGTAIASDHSRDERHGRERGGEAQIESKFYGTVERIPKDLNGVWVVSGREIVVAGDTRIKEKHGRADVGAYVKVEGNNTGKDFIAYEIEVKQAGRGR